MSELYGCTAFLLFIAAVAYVIRFVQWSRRQRRVGEQLAREQQRRDLALWEQELRQGQDR